jgi:multisubunit Na+/H+ antiporter MnhC subunit
MEKRSKLVVVGLAIIAAAVLYLIYVAGRGSGWAKPLPGNDSPRADAVGRE